MPSRAFLLFGRRDEQSYLRALWYVSMPSRAFLLFGRSLPVGSVLTATSVSMPSRAFLLFGHSRGKQQGGKHSLSFNALAGIFAFRTCNSIARGYRAGVFQCPRGHFCFSDAG